MDAGNFEIAQLDGNLDVTLINGNGTTVDDAGKRVTVGSTIRLVDASVNKSGNVFRLNSEGDTKYKQITASDWKVQTFGSYDYHAAVSWNMTISYEWASEGAAMGIYLDKKAANSYFTTVSTNAAATITGADSAKGFRIMFIDNTANTATVWGNHGADYTEASSIPTAYNPLRETPYAEHDLVEYEGAEYECKAGGTGAFVGDQTTVGDFNSDKWTPTFKSTLDLSDNESHASKINLRYVDSATAPEDYKKETGSVKGDYFVNQESYDRVNDGTGNTLKAERIATIAKPTGGGKTNSVSVTCIAWYEGEDPNVITGTAMKTLSAHMTLYARCDATTTA